MKPADLSHLSRPGARPSLRVSPGARAESSPEAAGGTLHLRVIAPPEKGKADAAVLKLLARARRVPKSRRRVLRGQGARDRAVASD